MAIFNLRAANNVTFHWTRDLSQFAAVYPIASGVIRMQARVTPDAADPPAYQWVTGATSGGVITFDPITNLAVFAAPEADMAAMSGGMVYDCRLELPGGVCVLLFVGRIVWSPGVTRRAGAGDTAETGIACGDTVTVMGETSTSPIPLPLSLSAAIAACQALTNPETLVAAIIADPVALALLAAALGGTPTPTPTPTSPSSGFIFDFSQGLAPFGIN